MESAATAATNALTEAGEPRADSARAVRNTKGIETSSKRRRRSFQINRNSAIGHGDPSQEQILNLMENRKMLHVRSGSGMAQHEPVARIEALY
jgi:hypothetical protein